MPRGKEADVPWLSWWTVGKLDLRLPEAEFWELTPCQFFALIDYSNVKSMMEDYRIGTLLELVHNSLAKKPKKWIDWFPQHKQTLARITSKKASRPISEKEAKLRARIMNAKFKLAEKITNGR